MDSSTLLNEIGELIDKKLDPIKQDVRNIKEQLNTVEMKVELINRFLIRHSQFISNLEMKVNLKLTSSFYNNYQ